MKVFLKDHKQEEHQESSTRTTTSSSKKDNSNEKENTNVDEEASPQFEKQELLPWCQAMTTVVNVSFLQLHVIIFF